MLVPISIADNPYFDSWCFSCYTYHSEFAYVQFASILTHALTRRRCNRNNETKGKPIYPSQICFSREREAKVVCYLSRGASASSHNIFFSLPRLLLIASFVSSTDFQHPIYTDGTLHPMRITSFSCKMELDNEQRQEMHVGWPTWWAKRQISTNSFFNGLFRHEW